MQIKKLILRGGRKLSEERVYSRLNRLYAEEDELIDAGYDEKQKDVDRYLAEVPAIKDFETWLVNHLRTEDEKRIENVLPYVIRIPMGIAAPDHMYLDSQVLFDFCLFLTEEFPHIKMETPYIKVADGFTDCLELPLYYNENISG